MRCKIALSDGGGSRLVFDLIPGRAGAYAVFLGAEAGPEIRELDEDEIRRLESKLEKAWFDVVSLGGDPVAQMGLMDQLLLQSHPLLVLSAVPSGGYSVRLGGLFRGWMGLGAGKPPGEETPSSWYLRRIPLASGPIYRFFAVPAKVNSEIVWGHGLEASALQVSEHLRATLTARMMELVEPWIRDGSLDYEMEVAPPTVNGEPWEVLPLRPADVYQFGRGDRATDPPTVRVVLDASLGRISRALLELRQVDGGWVLFRSGSGDVTLNGRLLRPSDGVEREDSEVPDRGGIRLLHGDRFGISPYLFEYQTRSIRRVDQLAQGEVVAKALRFPVKDAESGKTKYILDDVNTTIRSGEFIGILGGSGQGKSTLLNALSGLKPAPQGDSWIAGIPSGDLCRRSPGFIGFVPQDDIFHRELTVDQAFFYSARLRLRLPKATIQPVINQILEALGLTEHRSKPIYKLSGGQRKRCSIGIELLSKPAVLFLDEPSSGLDPATEADLMDLLQSLTATRLTVVCTTHVLQKAYIFNRIFFVHGGKIIFEGTTEEAEWFFDETGQADQEGGGRVPLERIYSAVLKGPISAEEWRSRFDSSPGISKIEVPDLDSKAKVAPPKVETTGFVRQFGTLMARQWRILMSDHRNLLFLVAQAVLIGVLVAVVAEKEGFRTFLGLIAAMWFGCSNGAQQIIGELPVFKREHLCGLGMHAYISSKFVFQSLISMVQSLLLFAVIILTSYFSHPNEIPTNFEELVVLREHPGKTYPRADLQGGGTEKDDEPDAGGFELLTESEENFIDALKSGTSADIDKARKDLRTSGYRDDEIQELENSFRSGVGVADQAMAPATIPMLGLYRFLAEWFHLQNNLAPNSNIQPGSAKQEVEAAKRMVEMLPLHLVVLNCLSLKCGAFLLAALAGVAMGLAVSSLVKTTTQAVMWVPLLLIPQILLGGYVITLADMSPVIRRVASVIPSYCVQRMTDVANLFGRTTPSLSNRTETPTFMTYGDGKGDAIKWQELVDGEWTDFEQEFYEESDANVSWQNLRTRFELAGQHRIVEDGNGVELEVVEFRRDVTGRKFDYFTDIREAYPSILILGGWCLISYLVILASLTYQRGR